jgi:hypothetical protein
VTSITWRQTQVTPLVQPLPLLVTTASRQMAEACMT